MLRRPDFSVGNASLLGSPSAISLVLPFDCQTFNPEGLKTLKTFNFKTIHRICFSSLVSSVDLQPTWDAFTRKVGRWVIRNKVHTHAAELLDLARATTWCKGEEDDPTGTHTVVVQAARLLTQLTSSQQDSQEVGQMPESMRGFVCLVFSLRARTVMWVARFWGGLQSYEI